MALISPFAVTDPYYVSWMFSDAQILEDSQTYYNAAIAFHVSIKDRRPEYIMKRTMRWHKHFRQLVLFSGKRPGSLLELPSSIALVQSANSVLRSTFLGDVLGFQHEEMLC